MPSLELCQLVKPDEHFHCHPGFGCEAFLHVVQLSKVAVEHCQKLEGMMASEAPS